MTMTPIRRFWRLLRLYKSEIRQIYIYALFIGIVNLTLPLGIQAIINFLQTGELTSTWVIIVCFVLIGIAVAGSLQVLQLRIVENIQQDLFARSAFEFAYRLPKISLLRLDKLHAPELVNRFFDTLTIQKGLPKILIDFSLAIFQIGFGLLLLAIYSPFFILLGVVLAFILWLIFKVTGPIGVKTSLIESKYKYQLVHWLEEIARVNRTFKLSSARSFHLEKTDIIAEQYLTSREKHFKVLLRQFRLFVGFKVILAASLLLLGGYLVFLEQMDIGQFVAAEIIIILIINSVEKVIRVTDTIYDVLTALEKIGYVTDLELDDSRGKAHLPAGEGLRIEAHDLQFGFPDDRVKIINGLSFNIAANEKVVLEGSSGSGKSLLLHLLSGIYPLDGGELYIDDIPMSNYQRDQFNDALGIFLSTNQLFDGSIRDNVTMGRAIQEQELMAVMQQLHLVPFLQRQEQGIDSLISSGGRRLPRGVIQKLLIARMIVHQPRLLLMEDPLQFVSETEKKPIIDYLMSAERKWTMVVISHYPYWQEKSDRSLNLDTLKAN